MFFGLVQDMSRLVPEAGEVAIYDCNVPRCWSPNNAGEGLETTNRITGVFSEQ